MAVLRTQTYAYDASSKVTSHTVDGVTTSYTYDGAGQLLTETRPGYAASYTYDGNGNRLSRTVNEVPATSAYDYGDKLLSVSVGGSPVKTYGYDLAGRATSVVSPGGTTTLTYDFEGRATSIVGPEVSQSNVYNGLDTRVGSTMNSVARSFLRDGAYVTDPVLKDRAAIYTPGVSERRGSTTTYLHSGFKNADAQSSTLGALTGTRHYDAFGNLAATTGTWTGPFGYAGAFGYQEDATGLRLLGHRLYDASTGRFLTRDPIKDGRNWYVYCDSDPVNYLDTNGLDKITLGIIRRGIANGTLPPGTAKRYVSDPDFRQAIHREQGERKKKGSGEKGKERKQRKNPNLTEEEVIDIVQDELEFHQSSVLSPLNGIDWKGVGVNAVIGLVVVGGAIIVIGSGGSLSAPAVGGGALIIGGLLASPVRVRNGGGL